MSVAEPHLAEVEALYSSHHGWLRAWLRRKLGSSEQAADLAHDTFLRLLSSRVRLDVVDEPRALLTTTAQHLLVDQARRQRIEQAYLAELALLAEAMEGAPSPEAVMIALQAIDKFSIALQSLPVKGREAFLQHYLEGQSQAQIAVNLGISVRMAQKYLAQGLLRCHQALHQG